MEKSASDFVNLIAYLREEGLKKTSIEILLQSNPLGISPGTLAKVQKDLYKKDIPLLEYYSSN
jgi:hypothetical protein